MVGESILGIRFVIGVGFLDVDVDVDVVIGLDTLDLLDLLDEILDLLGLGLGFFQFGRRLL